MSTIREMLLARKATAAAEIQEIDALLHPAIPAPIPEARISVKAEAKIGAPKSPRRARAAKVDAPKFEGQRLDADGKWTPAFRMFMMNARRAKKEPGELSLNFDVSAPDKGGLEGFAAE